jgi:hypothetical protein
MDPNAVQFQIEGNITIKVSGTITLSPPWPNWPNPPAAAQEYSVPSPSHAGASSAAVSAEEDRLAEPTYDLTPTDVAQPQAKSPADAQENSYDPLDPLQNPCCVGGAFTSWEFSPEKQGSPPEDRESTGSTPPAKRVKTTFAGAAPAGGSHAPSRDPIGNRRDNAPSPTTATSKLPTATGGGAAGDSHTSGKFSPGSNLAIQSRPAVPVKCEPGTSDDAEARPNRGG